VYLEIAFIFTTAAICSWQSSLPVRTWEARKQENSASLEQLIIATMIQTSVIYHF